MHRNLRRKGLAFVALGVSALFASLVHHLMIEWTAHRFVMEEHEHVFGIHVAIGIFFTLLFGFVMRYIVRLDTLRHWFGASITVSIVGWPIITAAMIVGGKDIHLAIVSDSGVPYALLASLFVVGQVFGVVYGLLGWFWLCRMTFTPTAKP